MRVQSLVRELKSCMPHSAAKKRIHFKTKTVTRDKERHYIIIKGSIQEKDITVVNIYAPNIGALKIIKQILTNVK